jgi:hypothetical protein
MRRRLCHDDRLASLLQHGNVDKAVGRQLLPPAPCAQQRVSLALIGVAPPAVGQPKGQIHPAEALGRFQQHQLSARQQQLAHVCQCLSQVAAWRAARWQQPPGPPGMAGSPELQVLVRCPAVGSAQTGRRLNRSCGLVQKAGPDVCEEIVAPVGRAGGAAALLWCRRSLPRPPECAAHVRRATLCRHPAPLPAPAHS